MDAKSKTRIESSPLSANDSPLNISEQVKACCTIAREKLEAGDYDEGCAALQRWWTVGDWPKHSGLKERAAAELLFTAGILSGLVGSIKQMLGGQKSAEGLLNGAITLFERLGEKTRVVEARVELACCYYRQGLFDLARTTLHSSLQDLPDEDQEIKSIALIRLAVVENHTGRLHDAVDLLNEAAPFVGASGAWTQGVFHVEFAIALKDLGISESRSSYFEKAQAHFREALSHFEQISNRRYMAIVECNYGYLLLTLKKLDEAQVHLERARRLFDEFGDSVRRAQVDETLAQLYIASEQYTFAQSSIRLAVETLETSGEEALLAEALTTHGLVMCKLSKKHEAKPSLERARRVAERCGDDEGAGKPLLIMIEEMFEQLGDDERREIGAQASQLLANSQQSTTRERLKICLERIASAHAEHEHERELKNHAEKMAALGELSFGVAHNVNNTLTGILGRAQLLRRTNDPEKMAIGLDMIIKSADDGAQIIRRIQDFARKAPSREFEAISVADLLKDVCEMTRPRWDLRADCSAINFALFAECKASIMGDPVELREVLVNIIYNAVDAMPTGGAIRLSAQEADDQVILKITDTGTGMKPEVKSRLFDPFFTTKGKAGTGMGLAVSFGIIRRHNGSIEVESEPGSGTTFLIALPKVGNAQKQGSASAARGSAFAAGGDRLRVLVVDDEVVVRDVLVEALESDGCEVIAAESGEEALRLYDENKGQIDLVFTDIGMAEMSGWELVTAIRKRSETVPLAIVSGWAEAISWDTRNAAKADWVISKPFDIGKISKIANEIAERKKAAKFPN